MLTWEIPQEIISGHAARPYIKLEHEVTRGHEKIHMAFTDGHPRDVSHNAIYYTCWNKDHLQKGESFIWFRHTKWWSWWAKRRKWGLWRQMRQNQNVMERNDWGKKQSDSRFGWFRQGNSKFSFRIVIFGSKNCLGKNWKNNRSLPLLIRKR